MDTFLRNTAQQIISKYSGNLDDISIILPSKRAIIYLQKALSEQIKRPFFSPNIVTLNEWIDQHTPKKIINQTEQLFLLYEVHRKIEKEKADDFGTFLKWGKIILSDFDEIDRNLIEANDIFKDLKSIDDIENWSFNEEELSPTQESYSTLWSKLPTYYSLFNEGLDRHNYIYQGKAYKEFLRGIKDLNDPSSFYYFVGFNALSKSESEIIKFLLAQQKAELIFDYDKFYTENKSHEAGQFYRQLKNDLNLKVEASDRFNTNPKNVELIECSSQIAQVHVAATILAELVEKKGNLDNTAVVLADESLLTPLLRSLPPELEKANISMGYPIRFSHLQGLVDLVFEIQFNFARFKNDKLYHKSILKLLAHPYLKGFFGEKRIKEFQKEISEKNQIFLDREAFLSDFKEFKNLRLILESWNNDHNLGFECFHQISAELYDSMKQEEKNFGIDLEILYHFHQGLKRFEDISHQYNYSYDLKSFKKLFYQFWQSESLSFLGNPTEGLQIIGVLESRALDFEELIVLGMNEGNLPKTRMDTSLIPYDLKRNYQLPTEEHREAIFAHHFYRLLHAPNNFWFTFNSSSDNLNSGEKSRYLIQIEHEMDRSKGHQFNTSTYAFGTEQSSTSLPSNRMSDSIREKMDAHFEGGLSPSAFNKLIRCPLDYYYCYILDLKEIDKVEENVEASTFGTKIHDTLELLFKELFLDKNIPLGIGELKGIKGELKDRLRTEYLKDYSQSDIEYGQNKLRFEVSVKYLEEIVRRQIEEVEKHSEPIEIVQLEHTLKAEYSWKIKGSEKKITLKGKADRIDKIGNHYRIIDYKSGKCEWKQVSLLKDITDETVMTDFLHHKDKSYARQLLLYALMFRKQFPEVEKFSVGIISMVNMKDWIQNVCTKKGEVLIEHKVLDAFEIALKRELEHLYSDEYIFIHDDDSEYCSYCES